VPSTANKHYYEMKITPLQYAKALFQATEHLSEPEAQAVIARFADRLQRDGQTKQLPRIIGKFIELWNKAHGIVDAEVTSRTPLGIEDSTSIKQFIMERYRAKEVVITNTIDKEIGGGVVVRVGDELLDGSVRAQLKKLQKQLGGH
jgi:F-type H+-transporting ATPase subunit delta